MHCHVDEDVSPGQTIPRRPCARRRRSRRLGGRAGRREGIDLARRRSAG